jgi:hypothetical protein
MGGLAHLRALFRVPARSAPAPPAHFDVEELGIMKASSIMFGLTLMLISPISIAKDLIGSIVPPYPDGLKDEGGACISRSLGADKVCEYSIGVLKGFSGLRLYVGKSAPRTDPKKARWLVTDEMLYPTVPRGHQVVFGNCQRNGQPNDAILAVVKTTDTEWYTVVRFAYEVNLDTGRFEETSPVGIRCYSKEWGL